MTTFPASCAEGELVERVRANLEAVRARLRAAGADHVRVVAVTKGLGVEYVRAAQAVGLDVVAENYVDELCDKRAALADAVVSWHFIGALQRNKITRALRCADLLGSLARDSELERVARLSPGARVDVQLNASGAPGRNGATPDALGPLIEHARDLGLVVRALMVVAPQGERAAAQAFALTARLAERYGVSERSMGMSDDFELAVAAGSTEVRLGRVLLGPRPRPGALA